MAKIDPNSIVDYLGSTGQANSLADRGKLYASTFGSTGGSYTGSAAQNMALLTKLKGGYSGTTNAKTISGSSSVNQNLNTHSALSSAASSLTTSKIPATSASSPTVPPPTAPVTNPVLSTYQTQTQTATTQAQNDAAVALKPITDTFQSNLSTLQLQKTNAVNAAKASYAKANPYGSGSDQDEFIASIAQGYDTQIQNATTAYSDAVTQNQQGLQDDLNTINATYQSNVLAYQQEQTQNLQWTLANDPPQPLNLKGVDTSSPQAVQSALMTWASRNQELLQNAFNTGSYGDENNMQDYLNAAYQLSSPTKAGISEETDLENAASNASRANSAAVSAGAAAQNANTNSANAGAVTTVSKPNIWQTLVNATNNKPNITTTVKTPSGSSGESSGSITAPDGSQVIITD